MSSLHGPQPTCLPARRIPSAMVFAASPALSRIGMHELSLTSIAYRPRLLANVTHDGRAKLRSDGEMALDNFASAS